MAPSEKYSSWTYGNKVQRLSRRPRNSRISNNIRYDELEYVSAQEIDEDHVDILNGQAAYFSGSSQCDRDVESGDTVTSRLHN